MCSSLSPLILDSDDICKRHSEAQTRVISIKWWHTWFLESVSIYMIIINSLLLFELRIWITIKNILPSAWSLIISIILFRCDGFGCVGQFWPGARPPSVVCIDRYNFHEVYEENKTFVHFLKLFFEILSFEGEFWGYLNEFVCDSWSISLFVWFWYLVQDDDFFSF